MSETDRRALGDKYRFVTEQRFAAEVGGSKHFEEIRGCMLPAVTNLVTSLGFPCCALRRMFVTKLPIESFSYYRSCDMKESMT